MDKEDLRIGDAVTRDRNNYKSKLYRIIEIDEDSDMLTLRELHWNDSILRLHKNQVELVTPYPKCI